MAMTECWTVTVSKRHESGVPVEASIARDDERATGGF